MHELRPQPRDLRRVKILALAAVIVSGCGRIGFDPPSSAGDGGDAGGRGDGGTVPDLCVPATCTSAGGSCQMGTCVLTPAGLGAVTCPSGMPCSVTCMGVACMGGVSCGGATSCEVTCDGFGACQTGGVDCASAPTCNVRCLTSGACQNGPGAASVHCRSSICDVTCSGLATCQAGIAVDSMGTCTSHCCGGACQGGTGMCANDNVCM